MEYDFYWVIQYKFKNVKYKLIFHVCTHTRYINFLSFFPVKGYDTKLRAVFEMAGYRTHASQDIFYCTVIYLIKLINLSMRVYRICI